MPNGFSITNEADFENAIEKMSDRDLSEFTARQVLKLCGTDEIHNKRLTALEEHDRKAFGLAGGIGGGAATVLGVAIIAVLKRLGIDVT